MLSRCLEADASTSSELSAHLLSLAEVPCHTHPTKHVDGLGKMCSGLVRLSGGLQQTGVTQVASSQLGSGFRVLQHSNGLQKLALPLRVRRMQPAQRLGQGSMSEGGAEPIAALLTQEDRFPRDSARLFKLAQGQEGFGKGHFPVSKDEPRADPLGQGEALLGEGPRAIRVAGSRVGPRLPELDDVDAEQVAGASATRLAHA